MKSLTIMKYVLCLAAFSLMMTSCSKENSEEVEVVDKDYGMEVTIRSSSSTYDAYAAYCNENGIESFSVSNNADLLGNDVWAENIADGDFVIHYRNDGTDEVTIGGTLIESTAGGQTLKTLSLTDSSLADITIDTADASEVTGSMTGDFLVLINPLTQEFETVSFSVTFAGEVDSAITPILCQ